MFIVIGIIVLGIVLGVLLRGRLSRTVVSKMVTWIIYLLLFVLGISVGTNEQIMDNLATLGYKALLISLSSLLVGCVLAWILYKRMFKSEENDQ